MSSQDNLRHSPWVWIPCLFVAEEIPSAMVTFVSLVMFLRFGASPALASLYSALLFLPWVLKSYMRSKVRNAAYFKRNIHCVETFIFLSLLSLAMYINYFRVHVFVLFVHLMVIAMLCAWHELLARMYYNRMLYPRQQQLYNPTKIFASQSAVVITYGILIIIAGIFEIFFRSIRKAWAMESYLACGVFFIFLCINLFSMQNPRIQNPYRYESLIGAFRNELHVVERIHQKKDVWRIMLSFFFLMLPQSLLFNTRVFFLMGEGADGGLDCSVQEVGFAQGAIGVTAFSIGIVLGRQLLGRFGSSRMFWAMALSLSLSPVFYVFMSYNPLVGNLMAICSMTALTQFMFGFGLNICHPFVHYISNERYRNTINYLYIPFVSMTMMLPMAVSGMVVTVMGYAPYLTMALCLAPVGWIITIALGVRKRLEQQ